MAIHIVGLSGENAAVRTMVRAELHHLTFGMPDPRVGHGYMIERQKNDS